MKKAYVKPRLTVEYFTLNQSVATSCDWTADKFYGHPTHGDAISCAWIGVDGTKYWTNQTPNCDDNYPLDIDVGEGCYNAPSGSQQVFAS